MRNETRPVAAVVAVCIVFHVLLRWGFRGLNEFAVIPGSGDVRYVPDWFLYVDQPLRALALVLPGLLAGWIAGRSGFAAGAVIGGTAAFIESMLFTVQLPTESFYAVFVLQLVVLALYPAVMSSMAGAAGELLSQRRSRPGLNSPLFARTT